MAIVQCWRYSVVTGGINPGQAQNGWYIGPVDTIDKTFQATADLPYAYEYKSCLARNARVAHHGSGTNNRFFEWDFVNVGSQPFNEVWLTLSTIHP